MTTSVYNKHWKNRVRNWYPHFVAMKNVSSAAKYVPSTTLNLAFFVDVRSSSRSAQK